jgi:hypothetical protein
MDNLNCFLKDNEVPNCLSTSIRDFHRYKNNNVTIEGSMQILKSLCQKLRTEVADYTDINWLSHSDLFEGCGRNIDFLPLFRLASPLEIIPVRLFVQIPERDGH